MEYIFMGIMALLAAGSSYVQIKQDNEVAETQAENANKASEADYVALESQHDQQEDAARLEQLERMRQGQRERATLRVAAGEAGVTGLSVERDVINSMFQEGYDISILEGNRINRAEESERVTSKVHANAQSRINEAGSRSVGSIAAGLQIAGAGTQGATKASDLLNK